MKIRALKTIIGMPRGTISDVETFRARELIAQGYAIEELPLAKQEAANDNGPFPQAGLIGSQTGADPLRSLLLEDQAPETQPSVPLVDEPTLLGSQSDSSSSTTPIDSAPGRTASTPATTTGGKRKRGRPRLQR